MKKLSDEQRADLREMAESSLPPHTGKIVRALLDEHTTLREIAVAVRYVHRPRCATIGDACPICSALAQWSDPGTTEGRGA